MLTGEERRWRGLHDSSFSISGLWVMQVRRRDVIHHGVAEDSPAGGMSTQWQPTSHFPKSAQCLVAVINNVNTLGYTAYHVTECKLNYTGSPSACVGVKRDASE